MHLGCCQETRGSGALSSAWRIGLAPAPVGIGSAAQNKPLCLPGPQPPQIVVFGPLASLDHFWESWLELGLLGTILDLESESWVPGLPCGIFGSSLGVPGTLHQPHHGALNVAHEGRGLYSFVVITGVMPRGK